MRRIVPGFIFIVLFIFITWLSAANGYAQAGDPWSLISEVNALRASYGLAAYEVNNALMAAAQAQSEYMLEIGSVTHSGPGGSRPHDRAVAFGYGGGAQVYVSENIAMGINLSSSQVVYEMWQDALHLETMISSNYRHIGAGVASSGDYVYYTIDVGYIAGSPGSGSAPPSSGSGSGDPGAPAATIQLIEPIVVATAKADGSIMHVVGAGQALWNIAAAYKIPLADLMALNGLNENSLIYPGDKLLIKTGAPATTGPAPSETSSPPPSRTPPRSAITPTILETSPRTPSERPGTTEAPLALARGLPTASKAVVAAQQAELPAGNQGEGPDYLLVAIAVLTLTGAGLVILGTALKRQAS